MTYEQIPNMLYLLSMFIGKTSPKYPIYRDNPFHNFTFPESTRCIHVSGLKRVKNILKNLHGAIELYISIMVNRLHP